MRIHVALAAVLAAAAALRALVKARPPAPIADNSFLIEEAYNQERGVVQHINTFAHPTTSGSWAYSFTQEWPAPGQRHQLSYTIPIVQLEGAGTGMRGIGDVAINYRYQLRGMHEERVAIAPRLTLLVPTGDAKKGTGAGGTGIQVNLPVSATLSPSLVAHVNAGATVTPRATLGAAAVRTTSWNSGASLIWLVTHRVNLMLEGYQASIETPDGAGGTSRGAQLLLSPGIRWSYDFANGTQVVPGIAVPLGVGSSRGSNSVFLYFSVEHPF